ncbi:MAG: ABC transporter substrate-binding protein [Cumulibacter sp.]
MRHTKKIVTSLLATSMLLAGCGDAPDKKSASEDATEYPDAIELQEGFDPDGHFDFGAGSFGASWDPIESTTGGDIAFYLPVYDRLFQMKPDTSIEPMLATGYEAAEDGTSMTITLRDGVKFSDGTPLDADAVKFNIERIISEDSKISGEIPMVTGAEVIDPLTVKLNVSGEMGALLPGLTFRAGIMVSPKAVKAGTLPSQPVGVGPYVVTDSVPGDHADFERSADYWEPEAQNVATMTYHSILDAQTRINALQTGEMDGIRLGPEQFTSAAQMGFDVISMPGTTFTYMMFNTEYEPFDDPAVRIALNYAVDRVGIADGLFEGNCTPQIQPVPEGSMGYSEKIGDGLDIWPYDPEKAKELLAEAGVKDVSITAMSTNISTYQKVAEVVQQNLIDVGIEVNLSVVPNEQVLDQFAISKTAEANFTAYSGIPEPNAVVARYLTPGAVYNPGNTTSQELLDLASKAATPVDPEERDALYEDFIDAWIEEPPHFTPICMMHNGAAFNDNVSGVSEHPTVGGTDLRYVAVAPE